MLPTKVLKRFLASLTLKRAPELLDLGPVVGSNVTFFGERLGCKIHVSDVYAELERAIKDDKPGELSERVRVHIPHDDGAVDGILCWDVFDYLDKATALGLARELVRILAPGGALLAFFSTVESRDPFYTRFVIVDDQNLRHRPYAASSTRQPVLANRDITRMFDGLTITESFLLLTKTREMLFRKPAPPAVAAEAKG
ncbi:MAG: class I SAM-dependent methyltransferase [Vicinamibacterales bacterium]